MMFSGLLRLVSQAHSLNLRCQASGLNQFSEFRTLWKGTPERSILSCGAVPVRPARLNSFALYELCQSARTKSLRSFVKCSKSARLP
ncbi:hypothetical protein D3875_13490 [Deinococcus cavernae]|uniref:Uncharacterized protein n=1 Tax=Deinococcus cavernae TaxID=2320857 RepID=A0A418V8H3_9DEIO|nr:hypothetical protein D3875_13490 [Deinococcus cavernae]